MSSSFVTTFLAMIGMTSGRTNKLWRSRLVNGVSELLRTPRIHARFATSQGDAAMAGLRALLKLHHDPHRGTTCGARSPSSMRPPAY